MRPSPPAAGTRLIPVLAALLAGACAEAGAAAPGIAAGRANPAPAAAALGPSEPAPVPRVRLVPAGDPTGRAAYGWPERSQTGYGMPDRVLRAAPAAVGLPRF